MTNKLQKKHILGSGIEYPFRFNRGRVEKGEGSEKLHSSLQLLFDVGENDVFMSELTNPMERLVFIRDRNVFKSLAERYILDIIDRFEPRIEYVQRIDFEFKDHEVEIKIIYKEVVETTLQEFVYKYELDR